MGDALDVREQSLAVDLGGVEFEISVAIAGEDHAAILTSDGFGVVRPGATGLHRDHRVRMLGVHRIELVAVVNWPNVALGAIRLGRAGRIGTMGAAVEDVVVAGLVERAGGAALSG
jgi:hypothetical protein